MTKTNKKITILSVGDRGDYDSYEKLNKEKKYILRKGFEYHTISYSDLLKGDMPEVNTRKVVIFLFFPFSYWNENIEHRSYRGVYGNYNFYRKFNRFSGKLDEIIKYNLRGKEILYVNDPVLSAFYRDKLITMDIMDEAGVTVPERIKERALRDIYGVLNDGRALFIKPRCGSMGKGITYLEADNWKTNFIFRENRIISRKSDHGWQFKSITNNKLFLKSLLKKNILIEEAITPLSIRNKRVDFRVYVFFGRILSIYPRKNDLDAVTTNISQGGRGDYRLLKYIPEEPLSRVKATAINALKSLGLNFAGVDVILDGKMDKAYAVDVNMFPGFPKRRTFNLARELLRRLKEMKENKKLRFQKS